MLRNQTRLAQGKGPGLEEPPRARLGLFKWQERRFWFPFPAVPKGDALRVVKVRLTSISNACSVIPLDGCGEFLMPLQPRLT